MKQILNAIRSRRFFSFWFGLGIPPFLMGTVVVAFHQSTTFGIVAIAIITAWIFDTFSTTCRRCQFYGSAKCGIPSLVVPFLLSKKSALSISLLRVRLHYYADVAMIFYVNFVYWHMPVLFPIVVFGSCVGWLVVFRPKKFHGLLFRLNSTTQKTAHSQFIPIALHMEKSRKEI